MRKTKIFNLFRLIFKNRLIEKLLTNLTQTCSRSSFISILPLNYFDNIIINEIGFDLQVLQGGVKTIEKFTPTLFIEINNRNLRQQGDTAEKYKKLQFVQPDAVMDTPPVLKNCYFDLTALSNED